MTYGLYGDAHPSPDVSLAFFCWGVDYPVVVFHEGLTREAWDIGLILHPREKWRVEALRLGRLDTGTNRCNSLPEGRSSEYPSCNISSPGKENDVSWERSNIQSAFQQPPGSEALSGGVGEPPLVCAGAALGCWVRRQCWSPFSWWFHQANMGMKLVEAASTKDGIESATMRLLSLIRTPETRNQPVLDPVPPLISREMGTSPQGFKEIPDEWMEVSSW